MMQCKENIMNLRKLLEIMSVMIDSNHLNDTFDKHTELISDCDIIKDLNERKKE